ncbi:hypothetical protein [Flagellimonas abyssi]|uniref:NB-ARC domain-containing protein n=1 Tax=Flagellimonas abyssi TaxID=2864871 RepID=A0ABS7EL68_9FLAO|nr:hypothetical protein [Allomuricauda abyssi]MBW8198320.1 hypothetical protein [Allomuricauda abyssi]
MYQKRNKILKQVWAKNLIEKEDSDSAYFLALLYTGELLTKLICASMLAGVEEDSKKHKYSQAYHLVRADGIGDWGKAILEIVSGPTSHHLNIQLRNPQKEITQKVKAGTWQHDSISSLNECLKIIGVAVNEIPSKTNLINWFSMFSQLRNKTRGHGALRSGVSSQICPYLEKSLELISGNFSIFDFEWAYLSQNLSGKYNVKPISENSPSFNFLKSNVGKSQNLENGVYIYLNRPVFVELIKSDKDLSDFYFPNGGFSNKRYEVLSYSTGSRDSKDNSKYLMPPGDLPVSETEGKRKLSVIDNCFTNLPKVDSIYIHRPSLENELKKILVNERHPMVTLLGRGGIGKTSMALRVLEGLCSLDRFQTIIWFSSRDIDLLESGAKSVQPQVLDIEDVAKEFVKLIDESLLKTKGFNSRKFIEKHLSDYQEGISPLLAVFDNFETVKNPTEMFVWLDTYIRTPNKILITSRISEFRADYPITVSGMEENEFNELVDSVSDELGITNLITKKYVDMLYEESLGHPYVAKILLGVVSIEGKAGNINRIVASQDELLTALFERTYTMLSYAAKKVFLTLSSWRSTIPKIALEAVLSTTSDTKMDVESAIDELHKFSFIDIYSSTKDNSKFISLPLSAYLFGHNKLAVSPLKQKIMEDREILMMFGVGKVVDVDEGVTLRFEKFFRQIAQNIGTGKNHKLSFYKPVLEYICRKHYTSWLIYATLLEEVNNKNGAIGACQQFIQNEQDYNKLIPVWKRLSKLYAKQKDFFGEIHSLIEMCAIDNVSGAAISACATRLNQLLSNGSLDSKEDEKKALSRRLITILNDYIVQDDNNLDDRTKLAWIYVHIKKINEARKLVQFIIEKDPNHVHAIRLAGKIGVKLESN